MAAIALSGVFRDKLVYGGFGSGLPAWFIGTFLDAGGQILRDRKPDAKG